MENKLPLLLISADVSINKKLLKLIDSLQFFSVDLALDSSDAIVKLREKDYKFIISDINIGDIDAWCLSSLIRSDIYRCERKTPIVLLTDTYSERIAEATAKSFGINAVLPKSESSRVNEILADAFSKSLPISDKLKTLSILANEELELNISHLLEDRFHVELSHKAKEGLSQIRQKDYDVIIIDAELENDSALPLLQTIINEQGNLPVVVLIPRDDVKLAETFMLHGASDFIYVPMNPARVVNICERAARRNDFIVSNSQFGFKVKQLEQSEQQYRHLLQAHSQLLSNISSVVMELNEAGQIRFINKAWQRLTDFNIEDCLDKNLMEFIDADELGATRFSNRLSELLLRKTHFVSEEIKLQSAVGDSIWVEIKLRPLIKGGEQTGIAATIDNINERKKAEEKLQHLALHDTLTGLFNRYYFDTELARLTLLASRGSNNHCLLYIDLDHFKIINDTEGHQMGDLVLKEVSQILSKRLRQSDILCRVGGDEFVILLVDTEVNDAVEIGNDICKQIADAHFQFGNNSYKISASIGVSEVDGNATGPEYLRQADIALYVAKNKGRNRTHCYTDDDVESKQQHDNLKWAHRLQEAVVNDSIVLHFQPVWDIKNNCVGYYEALVRLNINGTLVYPNDFIPALERAEDINLLDHQVISKAIKLIEQHSSLHKVAINLSAQAFSDERLFPLIKEKLEKYNLNGNRIIFELTESASLTNVSGTRRLINQINELGCQFSIDDFGTGFSTFAYLRELPAHSVKIDGSFVKDMTKNSADHTLVTAINNIAKALKKSTVAEFVEDKSTFKELGAIGVDYAQGYFISRPVPAEEIAEFRFEP